MMKKAIIALVIVSALLCSAVSALASDKYDLDDFGWRYVDSKGRGSLVFQKAPRGKSMKGHKFYTGDQIYVNLYYRENGYGIAYEDGEYGYVDASYINWGSSSNSSSSSSSSSGSSSGATGIPSSAKDLSDYEYLTVTSKGRGSLVFQRAPGGKSISGHKYYDGDQIYVNIYYRKDGYAVAYDNGVYGYVDASFIDWGNGAGVEARSTSSSIPASAKDLDNYTWFKVKSKGRGSLVFQERPRGKSIKGHKFYDGDWIYAHPDYRKDGYAVAYDDGVFGFVDASYIDWNS